MSYSRIPGIVAGSGSTRRASPAASVSGVEEPGPVGMNDGGQCGQAPRMTGWPSSITWEQFEEKAERPEGETENAFIHAEADLGANVSVCREEGRLRLAAFVVNLRVVEENCWVVRGTKTDDLLSHEQGHFDLAGLNARELMGRLAAIRADSAEELQRRVTEEIEASRVSSQSWSDDYDKDTNHGRKPDRQRRWKEAIQEAMDSGSPFQCPA